MARTLASEIQQWGLGFRVLGLVLETDSRLKDHEGPGFRFLRV